MSESQGRAKDEAAIRALVEDWASSVRRRDLRGILRNHSPNIVMFDVPPPLQSNGLEPYRRTWERLKPQMPNLRSFVLLAYALTWMLLGPWFYVPRGIPCAIAAIA